MKHGVDETVLPGQISSGEGPAGLPDLFWSFFSIQLRVSISLNQFALPQTTTGWRMRSP